MSKKHQETQAPKKLLAAATASELLPASSESDLLFGPNALTQARPDFFEKVTGLNENQLRLMSAEGYMPPFVRRRANITATIFGAIKCLLDRTNRKQTRELPDLASMDAAEGAGLFTKKFLQTLKAGGAPGFHPSGRIELAKLLPGIEPFLAGDNQHDKLELQREGVANYETMRVKYQALNEKLKHGELNGRLMDADTAIETGTAAQAIYFAMLDRLAVDFPGRLAGRPAAEIKHEVDATLKKIREAVEKEFESRATTARVRLETERKQEELLKI
jgi:hypothetical protein